ncbi:helix-turn-helix transcriptional regulator [Phytohabitans rumicis]|uniref:Transcriptional regulator n=1 Tax=Phytohabitans rumicis TaxID=1076125 RepID=A0A6V8LNH4_9ACTN|nr:hypothetical protein [Phytohabitans rumicis]GFJ96209.1 transcriptional regulator [Phytohabitans rumicis]
MLADRSRRALYDYVRHQDHPVGRDEAADATGMSRGLAAFHLDKLVEGGLLRAGYQTPAGQPRGRGRTPKVYEPAGDGVAVTVPERRYELIAEILADAVAADPDDSARAAERLAQERGQAVGSGLRGRATPVEVLVDLGYEPAPQPDRILLRNCPFHALAARQTALVCGLNLAFLRGLTRGLDADLDALLVPAPGACCVQLRWGQSTALPYISPSGSAISSTRAPSGS